jgi:beta-lactamase regulating signal transducer with metallopeptidase domain
MGISEFSVIMSIACSSVILFAAGFLVSHVKRVRWGLILLIMLLGFVRLVFPVELWLAKEVTAWKGYSFIYLLAHRKWVGGFTLAEILLLIWGIGLFWLFWQYLLEMRKLSRIAERATPVIEGDKIYEICEELKQEIGYPQKVWLAVTGETDTALSISVFTPSILIPKEMLSFTETELKGVLKHELTHYRRGDVAKKRIMLLIQYLFWWNPVLRYLRVCVNGMLELECDEHVCVDMSEEERLAYLDAIAKVLRFDDKRPVSMGIGFGGDCADDFLHRRFREVLAPVRKHSNVVTYILAAVSLVMFCLSYSFIVQPGAIPEEAKNFEVSGEKLTERDDDAQEFLIKMPDGSYLYVSNMLGTITLNEEEIQCAPYADLPIYDNTGKGE